ncbi:39S mitochondrial ribosomal protein L46-domain-containing protein [Durotheca rogersii]|uniref:39S mitochondrial ribosomal protein L46-domain-containing protein n=1 Tax=Durotheca rogersii TaxID=419775 RepID=UPI00221F5ED4|nr:39S mitochondrial ribosomal protein L46-domain-containing protein [Durotheca rogersii]KAI5863169.1 39S mitochondrial ribosomal protein L46-domain-containing protein [Durotheca rogersii]
MTASRRGGSAAAALLRRSQPSICASCRNAQFRSYSAAASAAATAQAPPPEPAESEPQPPTAEPREVKYRIKSGLILSRPPLLTRRLTPFENAFYFYQKRLNERLTLPFRHTLFFKKDTAPDLDWRIKFEERGQVVAKELGRYYARGRNAWNDELLVGSTLSDQDRLREILLKDAESRVTEDGDVADPDEIVPVERPMDRITEADKTNDIRRLDRKLDQTLYLIVKRSDGSWHFPTDDVTTDDSLHGTAARALEYSAGVNMNTWIVGRAPVAHIIIKPELNEDSSVKKRAEKIFFLKGRIMAGQADLKKNRYGLEDFNWLTKEELRKKLPYDYFHSVRNVMADR